MLLDANLLLYAVDADCREHPAAADWLESALSGNRRVAIPWQTIGAFLRVATHPRVYERPLTGAQARALVDGWLDNATVWIPTPSKRTARILGELIDATGASGNLIPDAQLAALAIEHGLAVLSADGDFARFPECRWINPMRAAAPEHR